MPPKLNLGEVKAKCKEIRSKIKDNPDNKVQKLQVADLVLAFYDVFGLLDEAMDEISWLRSKVEGTQEEIKNVKEKENSRIYDLEMKNLECNLIVKNVKVVAQDGEKETKEESTKVAEEIFKSIGVADSVKVASVIRFEKSKKYQSDRPPILLIKLKEAKMKAKLFKNVSKLRDTDFKDISISNQYPAALRPEMSKLAKVGNKMRHESGKTVKFRVEVDNGKAILKIKEDGDTEFKPMTDIPERFLKD